MKKVMAIGLAVSAAILVAICLLTEFSYNGVSIFFECFAFGNLGCFFCFLMLFPAAENSFEYNDMKAYTPLKITLMVLMFVLTTAAAIYSSYAWITAIDWSCLISENSVLLVYCPVVPIFYALFFELIMLLLMAVLVILLALAALLRPLRFFWDKADNLAIKLSEGAFALFGALSAPAFVYSVCEITVRAIKGDSRLGLFGGISAVALILCVVFISIAVILNLKPIKHTALVVSIIMLVVCVLPCFVSSVDHSMFLYVKDADMFTDIKWVTSRALATAMVTFFALEPVRKRRANFAV